MEGSNTAVGDEFTYRVPDVHTCKLRVVEWLPNEKVVWLVLDNRMSFDEDQSEWVGTTINFQIGGKGAQTEVRFAHLGLLPEHECFDVCSNAWGSLLHHSLPSLITTGWVTAISSSGPSPEKCQPGRHGRARRPSSLP